MDKIKIKTTTLLAVIAIAFASDGVEYNQKALSHIIWNLGNYFMSDNRMDESDDEIIPFPKQDSIKEDFSAFITEGGWTTNQIINGIKVSYSNNMASAEAGDEYGGTFAFIALDELSKIDHPAAREFLAYTITNDSRAINFVGDALNGLFRYSTFEPEVMEFMRSICVQTNLYRCATISTPYRMIDCATNLPPEQSGAAITNVSKFLHFSLFHLTSNICYTEKELMSIIPEYSNSVQRLAAMRYVAATATNNFERANASNIVERLSAMPTNELNNIKWIEQ